MCMKARLCVLFLVFFSACLTVSAANKNFTLVIDAGHGGNDAGAIGAITKEKTINLNVALAFGKLVERNCSDVRVIYTRTSDIFVPLHKRADIANHAKADLFVSIHTNSLPKGRIARGVETYTLGMHRANDNLEVAKRENSVILIERDYKQRYQGFDPNSAESYIMFEFMQDRNMAQSVELAKYVQKYTCQHAKRQDKGVKQAGFLVLRETSMPSCLIELGFISTADEERFLASDAGVQQLARGIFEAFKEYRSSQTSPKKSSSRNQQSASQQQSQQPLPQAAPQPSQPPVAQQPTAPAQPAEAPQQGKKRKSRMAEELAAARDGQLGSGATGDRPQTVDADSILQSEPDSIVKPVVTAVTPTEPAKAASQPAAPAPQPAKPATQPAKPATGDAPVFKVQILASGSQLKANSPQLKGQKDADFYKDGGLYKYTVGASTNYNEIYQLRRSLASRFPQCFIVAFKNGKRTDVQQAIQEFKARK